MMRKSNGSLQRLGAEILGRESPRWKLILVDDDWMGDSLEFLEGVELRIASRFDAKNLTIVVSCSQVKPGNWQVLVLVREI
jgi:hypothetical protein